MEARAGEEEEGGTRAGGQAGQSSRHWLAPTISAVEYQCGERVVAGRSPTPPTLSVTCEAGSDMTAQISVNDPHQCNFQIQITSFQLQLCVKIIQHKI